MTAPSIPLHGGISRERGMHHRISEQILAEIRDAHFEVGDKLPSQMEFMKRFGVSAITIRQALATLVKCGVLRSEQGKGYFVSLKGNDHNGHDQKLRNVCLLFERYGHAESAQAEDQAVLEFVNACCREDLRVTVVEAVRSQDPSGRDLLKSLEGMHSDGVCIHAHYWEKRRQFLEPFLHELPCPVLLFTLPYPDKTSVDTVDMTMIPGVRAALDVMIGLGHQRIAYAGVQISDRFLAPYHYDSRWAVYLERMTHYGLPCQGPKRVIKFGYTREMMTESTRQQLLEAVRGPQGVTAILAENDWMARKIIHLLWENGIRVPQNVSVCGYDDLSFARDLIPPLSSVRFPFAAMSKQVIALMRSRVRNPDEPVRRVTVPTEFVMRGTIAPPPVSGL